LSKMFGNIASSVAAALKSSMTIVRAQQSIVNASSTRMYICVVDVAGLAIHVLALSAMEATHVGMLEWPTAASAGNLHPPLQCALLS
jgi:hypothetical protein